MKKQILAVSALCAALFAITAKTNDPVLMKVGPDQVRLSEFEYLYHKNNAQQAQPQTIDEYVDMFVNFKLKVAAAEAAGIDTTRAFTDEYTKFRNELADPYLRDAAAAEALEQEAYKHMLEDVTVSHIMVRPANKALADSLYNAITSGAAKYEDIAAQYSVDKPSAVRGGFMGPVTAGRYPWKFEKTSYDTPVGQVAAPINSGFGWHIIRVESRTPAKGQVHAAHILRMTRGESDSVAAAQKVLIDSIYAALTATPAADFAEIAQKFSQDPGSARRGGDLGFFGPGMMVHEFDSTAFALADGQISRPFKTSFGWHIIKRFESKGPGSFEDNRDAIAKTIARDPERNQAPVKAFTDQAIKEYNGALNENTFAHIAQMARKSNGLMDSAFVAEIASSNLPVFSLNGQNTPLSEFAAYIPSVAPENPEGLTEAIRNAALDYMATKTLELKREQLLAENPDYRNLINEYRDGILLFEISNREVWNRAATDTAGLAQYFADHRQNYSWDAPKYKAVLFFARTDSALNEFMAYAADSIPATVPADQIAEIMKKRFGREVKVERVIAAKGENAITDFLGFGGEAPAKAANNRWPSYAAFRSEIIARPQEVADVRAAVVADYQNQLEKQWLDRLHKEIPVKVNKKVLKQAK